VFAGTGGLRLAEHDREYDQRNFRAFAVCDLAKSVARHLCRLNAGGDGPELLNIMKIKPTEKQINETRIKLERARTRAGNAIYRMIRLNEKLGYTEKQAETAVYHFCKGYCGK
jgi:hypothetical protein